MDWIRAIRIYSRHPLALKLSKTGFLRRYNRIIITQRSNLEHIFQRVKKGHAIIKKGGAVVYDANCKDGWKRDFFIYSEVRVEAIRSDVYVKRNSSQKTKRKNDK